MCQLESSQWFSVPQLVIIWIKQVDHSFLPKVVLDLTSLYTAEIPMVGGALAKVHNSRLKSRGRTIVSYSRMSNAFLTSSLGGTIIISIQLKMMVARMSKSKNWLHTTWMQNFLNGFHGAKRKRDLVAVNRKMVKFLNFLAIATNDYK